MTTKVVVGVAGAGKTSYAMGMIEQELRNGLSWNGIGFCSFSRAACLEAAERAAKLTGESIERLQKYGHFKTIHASVLRCLGIDHKSILDTDSKDGQDFLKDAVGAKRGGDRGSLGQKVDEVLSAWDFVRARLTLMPDGSCVNVHAETIIHPLQTSQLADTSQIPGTAGTAWDSAGTAFSCAVSSSEVVTTSDVTSSDDGVFCSYTPMGHKINFGTREISTSQKAVILSSHLVTPYRGKELGRDSKFSKLSSDCPAVITDQERRALGVIEKNKAVITAYQRAKELFGRLDFTDLLMMFVGIGISDDLQFHQKQPMGDIPAEVEVWLIDEAQDCSRLLWLAAERLSGCARDVVWLGDAYQSVYGFSGAQASNFEAEEMAAEQSGNRLLLNRSWRNPDAVLEWGEEVLREGGDYRERNPFGEAGEGSVGLMDERDFMAAVHEIAGTDTMVLARTWFALEPVMSVLNDLTVPWKSTSEERSSRWQCPAKIAFTLVMRDLAAGKMISEQDWRRVTENLPVKQDGIVLFERGAKAKWKKTECRREPELQLDQVVRWGATPEFASWVRSAKWKKDMLLLLDHAIEKFGVDEVRNPSVRVGTVHSVKGAEARNIFCLAGSTERVVRDADQKEETCLKYVAITRASQNYRLVVNRLDMQRGKPLFWAAPAKGAEWVKGLPDLGGGIDAEGFGSEDSDADYRMGENTEGHLDLQIPSGNLRDDWSAGPDSGSWEQVPRSGSQDTRRPIDENAGTDDDAADLDWCKL